jgi:hypothetical protein
MSVLQQLGINTQAQLNCVLGTFLACGEYKKTKLTKKILDNLRRECHTKYKIKPSTKEKLIEMINNTSKPDITEVKVDTNVKLTAIEKELKLMQCYKNKYHSSVDRGVEFKLTFPQFKTLMKAKHCYYTDRELHHEFGVPSQEKTFNQVSLERLDSSRGYTKQNTVPVCHGMNQLRSKLELKSHSNKYELQDVLNMVIKLMEVHNGNN